MLIALGAVVEATKVVPWASLTAAMTKAFAGKNQEVNLKALERGRGLIGA
jgi:Pyruvate/2-oxoacid:ferredoxin oxidoreductase gamma subunit